MAARPTDSKLRFKYCHYYTEKVSIWALFTLKSSEKMRILEKCRNNHSDNPLTSRRTDGGKTIVCVGILFDQYATVCLSDLGCWARPYREIRFELLSGN